MAVKRGALAAIILCGLIAFSSATTAYLHTPDDQPDCNNPPGDPFGIPEFSPFTSLLAIGGIGFLAFLIRKRLK